MSLRSGFLCVIIILLTTLLLCYFRRFDTNVYTKDLRNVHSSLFRLLGLVIGDLLDGSRTGKADWSGPGWLGWGAFRFLSFVSIKVFACPGSLRSNPKTAPSQFNFSLPLAPCPLRSFFPSLDVSIYDARLYPYFFSLRGDTDLTVKDFLGN